MRLIAKGPKLEKARSIYNRSFEKMVCFPAKTVHLLCPLTVIAGCLNFSIFRVEKPF
jgi:hypothetical protein